MRRAILSLLASLIVCAPARAQGEPWSGTWESDAVRLELGAGPSGYGGALAVGGQTYPVQAALEAGRLRGAFGAGEARYGFVAELEGDVLRLVSDGHEHRLRRVGRWTWEALTLPPELGQAGAAAARAAPAVALRAPELLRATLQQLGLALGAAPRPVSALCDAEGREGQLLFEGRVQGAPVRGVVLARTGAEGGPAEVQVAWTRAEAFAGASGALLQALRGQGAAPAAKVEWQPVWRFPDGSGQVRLPAGWQATFAQKGAIDASGPEGSLSLGAARTVMIPAAAAQMFARPPLVAAYTTPAQVLVDLLPSENAWAQQANARYRTESLRVLEQAPTEYPQGQAAYLHTEAVILDTTSGQRTSWRGLTLVVIAPVSNDSFMYYTSLVTAPADRWARSLPVLLEIWRSWQVSQEELNRRLNQAAATMREITQIMQGVNADRQRSYDATNRAFGHLLRGDWPIEDTTGGQPRAAIDDQARKPLLEELNREAGYERWREVPLRDLVR